MFVNKKLVFILVTIITGAIVWFLFTKENPKTIFIQEKIETTLQKGRNVVDDVLNGKAAPLDITKDEYIAVLEARKKQILERLSTVNERTKSILELEFKDLEAKLKNPQESYEIVKKELESLAKTKQSP